MLLFTSFGDTSRFLAFGMLIYIYIYIYIYYIHIYIYIFIYYIYIYNAFKNLGWSFQTND